MNCFKRILSITTAAAILIGFTGSVTGCSMKEFFNNESGKDKENKTAQEMAADGTITNSEWLAMVNDAFGMEDEQVPADDLETAKAWGVIGEEENVDMEAPLDNQFATRTLMRATGFVDTSTSDEDVIKTAIDKGIINKDTDLTDPQKAIDTLTTASDAWSSQTFDYSDNTQLAEGVQDFREQIPSDSVKISSLDNTVTIPSEYAKGLKTDSVYILPPDEEYEDGRAMKVISVTDNHDGTSSVKSVKPELEELYSKLDFSGGFTPDYDNIEILDENANVTIGDAAATGMSCDSDQTGSIQPLSCINDDSCIQQTAQLSLPTISFQYPLSSLESKSKLPDVTKKSETCVYATLSNIKLNADVDLGFDWGIKIKKVYAAVDYKQTLGIKYTDQLKASTDKKNMNNLLREINGQSIEKRIEVAKLPVKICAGVTACLVVSVVVTASGYISVEVSTNHTKGFELKNGNLRKINDCSDKEWTVKISGSIGIFLAVALELNVTLIKESIVKLELQIGPKAEGKCTFYDDMTCVDIDCYLSITLTLSFHKIIGKVLKREPRIVWTLADASNAPLKDKFHLEIVCSGNGISFNIVPKCTHGQNTTTTEATTTTSAVPDGKLEMNISYLALNQDGKATLSLKSKPSGTDITWSSSNPNVVSVDDNGNITGVSSGSAVITVKTADGKQTASCAITVRAASGYKQTNEQKNIGYTECPQKLMAA